MSSIQYCNLIESSFVDADIKHTDFMNSEMTRCRIHGVFRGLCLFSKAKLNEADLSGSLFYGEGFSETNFSVANAINSIFRKCVFKGASLMETNLENTDFTDTYFELVDMRKSNLKNTNFSKCMFNKFNIYKARLENTDMSDTRFIGFLQAKDAEFINVNFTGAKGKLDKCILENTIYEKTGLPIGVYTFVTDEDIKRLQEKNKDK
jgi:uncharacterized protein YjbI with pentapeptide repeats